MGGSKGKMCYITLGTCLWSVTYIAILHGKVQKGIINEE